MKWICMYFLRKSLLCLILLLFLMKMKKWENTCKCSSCLSDQSSCDRLTKLVGNVDGNILRFKLWFELQKRRFNVFLRQRLCPAEFGQNRPEPTFLLFSYEQQQYHVNEKKDDILSDKKLFKQEWFMFFVNQKLFSDKYLETNKNIYNF